MDKDILSKFNHKDGMKVPDGYFADFANKMELSLPEKVNSVATEMLRSVWQRIRPYVYMAAMFAGIWCMLKMFTLMSSQTPQTLENSPMMAKAFSDESFVNDYLVSELDQWDVYDQIIEDGITPDTFLSSLEVTDNK